MTWQAARAVQIPIFGIGGIASAQDALEFLIAGARAVQIGTANFVDPGVYERILAGLARLPRAPRPRRHQRSVVGTLEYPGRPLREGGRDDAQRAPDRRPRRARPPAQADALVERLRGASGCSRSGSQLFTAAGPDFVRELVGRGEKVFLDLKYHDIPNTVAGAVRRRREPGRVARSTSTPSAGGR